MDVETLTCEEIFERVKDAPVITTLREIERKVELWNIPDTLEGDFRRDFAHERSVDLSTAVISMQIIKKYFLGRSEEATFREYFGRNPESCNTTIKFLRHVIKYGVRY